MPTFSITRTEMYNSMAHKFFRDLRERKDEQDKEIRRELSERIAKLEAKRKRP